MPTDNNLCKWNLNSNKIMRWNLIKNADIVDKQHPKLIGKTGIYKKHWKTGARQ